MPRVKRRKSYWLANTGSKALVLEPGEGTPNGAGLFLPEASNQILSLTNPQTFDEADTLIGLRSYCWLRFNPEEGSALWRMSTSDWSSLRTSLSSPCPL